MADIHAEEPVTMHDSVTAEKVTPGSQEVQRAVQKAAEAPTLSAAQQELRAAEKHLETLVSGAKNNWQRRILMDYFASASMNQALAEAALLKLLQSENEEVVLKAAKELRALSQGKQTLPTGGPVFNVDRLEIAQPEDPAITELKGAM